MTDIQLTFAAGPYERVQPLATGEVKPKGIILHAVEMPTPDLFYQQLKFSRFDVSEMSFSFFLAARARGWPYRALPVFHNRAFAYTTLQVHADAGIRRPEDLKGKRLGTFDYMQTAALWLRGQLQHEFGVRPEDIQWLQERPPAYSVASALPGGPPALPPGLRLTFCQTDLATMFLRREVDGGAAILPHPAEGALERPKVDLRGHRKLKLLFPDPKKEAIRYFKKNGVYPPHHLTVVRESVLREHPWVATSLMEAFDEAKKLALGRLYLRRRASLRVFGEQELEEQRRVFGDDPFPHGIKANAKAIDMVQTYSVEQGFTPRKQPLQELFAEEVIASEERLG
ncbi:MAG: ABC transporter substrate-binding protein [Chloroflexi bacterium]|nr:ABC transporter substrate-binding protein [Chloroflexota bacterium]